MNLRQVGIGLPLLLGACLSTPVVRNAGSSGGEDGGPPATWQDAVQSAAGSPAAYAILEDEQGPYLGVVSIVGDSSSAGTCAEALGAASSQVPLGAWTLELATPAEPGQYAVLSAQGDSIYPNIGVGGSVVRLVRLESAGSALQMYPVSGSVSVVSGPASLMDERAGQHLTGSYHLGFAAEPLQGTCSYATATFDLGDQVIATDFVCSCDTTEGQVVAACDGGGGNFVGCCFQGAPATVIVDGTFDAAPCPGLCVAPLGIPKACHPLEVDAGGA